MPYERRIKRLRLEQQMKERAARAILEMDETRKRLSVQQLFKKAFGAAAVSLYRFETEAGTSSYSLLSDVSTARELAQTES